MSQPLYEQGEVVYLVESASAGSLECVRIAGISKEYGNWYYTVETATSRLAAATTYGDRISHVTNGVVKYQEREFCTLCNALNTVKSVLLNRLQKIEDLLSTHCDVTG